MAQKTLQEELGKKADNASQLAKAVAANGALLPAVLHEVSSSEPGVKYKSIKVLKLLSEENPAILYPYFSRFEELLDSNNNILKWNAIDILANLAAVDSSNRFASLFQKFYSLLHEGSLTTAAHVIDGLAKVAKARPALEDGITSGLLGVEELPLPTEECRNILRGKIVSAFSRYCGRSGSRELMLSFARGLLACPRPATRKKAEQFLRKFGGK
jgi:hypothetical protein